MGVLRDGTIGFWGQPTATLDWCESNYEVTYFIAEFWNTLSNLFMIVPPIWSMIVAYKDGIERRYMLCYIFLSMVGIGSWCFHMTLIYEMQLLDEIPMVWGTLVLIYVLTPVVYPKLEGNSTVTLALLLYGLTLTSIYLIFKHPLIHQVGYALLMAIALYLDICIIRTLPCDTSLFYTAVALYYTGFAVWNVDNLFCAQLADLRSHLPVIFKPLTQLHAWWHCLAGYGSYVHIYFCVQSRAASQKKYFTWRWSGLGMRLVPGTKIQRKKLYTN